jgi:hypothetical protein
MAESQVPKYDSKLICPGGQWIEVPNFPSLNAGMRYIASKTNAKTTTLYKKSPHKTFGRANPRGIGECRGSREKAGIEFNASRAGVKLGIDRWNSFVLWH